MEKKQKQLIILGILILALVIVSINSCITIKKKLAKARQPVKIQPKTFTGPAAVVQDSTTSSGSGTERISEKFSWGADPFSGRRIEIGSGGRPTLTVSGIVYNKDNPQDSYAIIDNAIVRLGDTIANTNFKITEIAKDRVTISDGKSELKLNVW